MAQVAKNNKGITITQLKSGYYQYSFRMGNTNPKKQYGSSCKTKDYHEAVIYANERWEAKKKELAGAVGHTITLDKLCELYTADREPHVKAGSWKQVRSMLNHVRGFTLNKNTLERVETGNSLADPSTLIHKITQQDFYKFYNNHNLTNDGLRIHLNRIDHMFRWAKDEGYAVPDINWKKHNNDIFSSKPKMRQYTHQEAKDVVAWLEGSKNPENAMLFRILYALGLRIAAGVAIKIADVDLDNRTINIKLLKKGESAPETNLKQMGHTLTKQLRDYIERLPEGRTYLFEYRGNARAARGQWLAVCLEDLGFNKADVENLTTHSCRATRITQLIDSGVNDSVIQKHVDHARIQTTLHYNKMSKNRASEIVADVVDEKFSI